MTHFPTLLRDEIAELETERAALSTELDALASDPTRSADKIVARSNEIASRGSDITALIAAKQDRLGELDVIAEQRSGPTGPNFIRGANPWGDMPTDRDTASEVRSRALTGIERWDADDELKESATATVNRVGADTDAASASRDVRGVAAHVLRYSDPLYCSAFRKYATDPEGYLADFTREEAHVWRSAREEQRAALGTAGAVLPSPLDPTIVLTNDGAVDPMRALARVDTTTSNSKRYITSAGSTFSFDAELAEVSDDTFTETEVEIDVHRGTGFVQASLEAAMDQPGFDSEVAKIIGDGKRNLEAGMFINGTGTNQPTGIEVALNGGASEINAAGEALVADDVYGLLEALPPRFRENATWQMELSTRNFIHRLFSPTGSEPALIEGSDMLGVAYMLNSSIDPYSAVDAAATATNRVLFVGDWSKYVVLDRIGTQVFYLPPGVLTNTANNLPDGRVGWFATWRTGAAPLSISAFRMLDVATAA